ncbi:MAG: transcription antitermination factor NusB [Kiritimatiellia bacterium]
MVTRRQGREWALQMLVQFDLNPPVAPDLAIRDFWEQQRQLEADAQGDSAAPRRAIFTSGDPKVVASLEEIRQFAEVRVLGVLQVRSELDDELVGYLKNWSLYRLGTVERNVLRLGIWEMSRCADRIPDPITINECVDLAKFFSETKSGRFVNGVLDKYAKDHARTEREYTP